MYINTEEWIFSLCAMATAQKKSYRNLEKEQIFMINSRLTIKVLATLQPRVPAPSSRHFADTIFSKSSVGTNRQHINFKLRSTDDSANLWQKKNSDNASECILVLFFFFSNRAINYFTWGSFVVAVFKKERKQCDRPLCFPSLRHMPVVLTPFPSSVFDLHCLLAFLCFYCW